MDFATTLPDWAFRHCDPLTVTAEQVTPAEQVVLDQVDNHPDVKAATVLFRDECSGVLTVEVLGYSARECWGGGYNSLCLTDEIIEVTTRPDGRVFVDDFSGRADRHERSFDDLIDNLQTAYAEAAYEMQQYG